MCKENSKQLPDDSFVKEFPKVSNLELREILNKQNEFPGILIPKENIFPVDDFFQGIQIFEKLLPSQRLEIMAAYCVYCGNRLKPKSCDCVVIE